MLPAPPTTIGRGAPAAQPAPPTCPKCNGTGETYTPAGEAIKQLIIKMKLLGEI
jgi:hypothetical protein